ncbi:hypothetical protein J7T55_011978 [Diaporthe amygdali]|uniref:uncharacterized protein n=1 Tax=Phomopsis amygdali TaxID=1214568 RepID=UPI0022FE8504|nr:uncharacterized protein J7T55_011978 [Diaporthe amygdali]KAJ0123513.1 hypothetical protein J7T55_011978 [Diaporthe amygdali]
MDKVQEAVQPRDTVSPVIPNICYDSCNNAYIEAQSRGEAPSLCDQDSAFTNYYEGCIACMDQNATQIQDSTRQALDSFFSEYIDYCEAFQSSWLTWYTTVESKTIFMLPATGSSTSQFTVWYESSTITSTLPAYFIHFSAQSLISTYIPPAVFSELAASVASAASMASVTGDATSLVYSVLEDTSRPPWFSSAVPSTYAAQMSTLEASLNELLVTSGSTPSTSAATSTQRTTPTGSGSKAWIAGAVVGSVAGAALILLGFFLFLRHKRRAMTADKKPGLQGDDKTYMTGWKPELHSDPVPQPPRVYEMDASQNISEMEVHEIPQELHVDQVRKTPEKPT